jgi:hypothetical protein
MPPRALQRLRNILPWGVGLCLLGLVLAPYTHGSKRDALLGAFTSAPWWTLIIAAVAAIVTYLADVLATYCVLRWSRVALRFKEVLVMRGVTYFLAIVNYSLGQAALIFVLSRHGVRPARATGIILFTMGVNVLVLLAFAATSLLVGADTPLPLRHVLLALTASVPVYLLLIVVRPAFLAQREFLTPLFEMGIGGHIKAMVVRLPHVATLLVAHWVLMRCFSIAVPVTTGLLYLPILFAAAVLPLSALGLGTTQILQLLFFAQFAGGDKDAQVLAFSVYQFVVWIFVQIVIGFLCARTEFGTAIARRSRAAEAPEAQPAPP